MSGDLPGCRLRNPRGAHPRLILGSPGAAGLSLIREAFMSESTPIPVQPTPIAPNSLQLFVAFSLISVSGFGGVLYWSRRMMVDERKWMTAEEFNEAYALCNFLPGPNIVNFSVVFGRQVGGTVGALVALLGLLGPPFLVVTLLGQLYAYNGDAPALQRVLAVFGAPAGGLTVSTGLPMAGPLLRQLP